MNCPNDQILSAFHDRELPADEAARIESHLASCCACGDVRAAMRMSSNLVQNAGLLPVAGAMLDRWSSVTRLTQDRSIRRWTASLTGIAASVLIAASLLQQPSTQARAPAIGEIEQWAIAGAMSGGLAGEDESSDASSSQLAAKWMAADLAMRSQGGDQP